MTVAVSQYYEVTNEFWDEAEYDREQGYVDFVIPTAYIKAASANRQVERMEDGRFFAEIPGFDGVWAQGSTENGASTELEDVLISWLTLKMRDNDNDIPIVGGIDLNR
jgi:predicted RNase H-like HicB family nuclease